MPMESVADREPDSRLVVANVAVPVPFPLLKAEGVSQDGSLENTDQKHPLGATTLRHRLPLEDDTMTGDGRN